MQRTTYTTTNEVTDMATDKRKPPTMAQRRQRELAWALYITEGYIANMTHHINIKCLTLTNADYSALLGVRRKAEAAAADLRKRMSSQ